MPLASTFHPFILFICPIRCLGVRMNRNYQSQPHRSFGRRHAIEKIANIIPSAIPDAAVAPEGNQIQIGSVQHQSIPISTRMRCAA